MKPYDPLKALKPEEMTDADLLKVRDLCIDLGAHVLDVHNWMNVLVYLAEITDLLITEVDRRGIEHGCDGRMDGDWEYPDDLDRPQYHDDLLDSCGEHLYDKE